MQEERENCVSTLETYRYEDEIGLHSRTSETTESTENLAYLCALAVVDYKCKLCDFKSNLKVELLKHSLTIHKNRKFRFNLQSYICLECNFMSFSEITVEAHNCRPRPRDEYDIFSKYPLQTPDLKSRNQKSPQRMAYNQCSFKTLQKTILGRHVSMKHKKLEKNQWFECSHCEYKSNHKHNLKLHIMRRHTKQKRFECDHCPYKSVTRVEMHIHKTKHMKPVEGQWFICYHCGYKSRVKHRLQLHILRWHMKPEMVKWFACKQCTYKTIRKDDLNKHKAAKHTKLDEGQWFACDHCGYKSCRKTQLKLHVLYRHTKPDEGQWFACDHCGYKSRQKKNLKRHIFIKHANQKVIETKSRREIDQRKM